MSWGQCIVVKLTISSNYKRQQYTGDKLHPSTNLLATNLAKRCTAWFTDRHGNLHFPLRGKWVCEDVAVPSPSRVVAVLVRGSSHAENTCTCRWVKHKY